MSSGAYVESTRSNPLAPIKARFGQTPYPGIDTIYPFPVTSEDQRTYSFRTKGVSEAQILDEDRKVTRNGFSTFNPVYDTGHEFWTQKRTVLSPAGLKAYLPSAFKDGNWLRTPLVPRLNSAGQQEMGKYPEVLPLRKDEVALYGQRAINNTAPTAPQANAAVFIGELFSSLPAIPGVTIYKDGLQDFRSAGSEYLNAQFGWAPFVADLEKIVRSLLKSTTIIKQLSRDNGRNVRRRFAFPAVRTTREFDPIKFDRYNSAWCIPSGLFPKVSAADPPSTYVSEVTTRRLWFSGCFSYAIPVADDLLSRLNAFEAKANVLLGTRLTPEVLWELAPWSWLVDWKYGIGQALSSATALSEDGLVIRYGYLMAHTKSVRQYTVPATRLAAYDGSYGATLPPATLQLTTERKERWRSTPYGFGLNTDAFSDTQWEVLAALGMSRSPKRLIRYPDPH